MGNSSVDKFLTLVLRSRWDANSVDMMRAMAAELPINWTTVTAYTISQGLAPAVYDLLRDRQVLPAETIERLRSAYLRNAARNTVMVQHLQDALAAMAAEQVTAILLKGAALIHTVYNNVAVRPMGDLDILIRRNDLEKTRRALAACGYRQIDEQLRDGATLDYHGEMMVVKPTPPTSAIDIHWSLLNPLHYQQTLSLKWFWQSAEQIQIGETGALGLCPEAQIVYLCAHYWLHHQGQGLMWIHDIARVVVFYQASIDWAQVLAGAEQNQLILPLKNVLSRLRTDWRVPIPAWVFDQFAQLPASIEEARVFKQLTEPHRSRRRQLAPQINAMPRWSQRWRFLLTYLFPSPAYMRQRYRIPSLILLPLYYPYRWYLGLRSELSQD